jgi:hypothetical protein
MTKLAIVHFDFILLFEGIRKAEDSKGEEEDIYRRLIESLRGFENLLVLAS